MAEYIDREEAIDKLTMLFPLLKKRTIKSILKAVPTADVIAKTEYDKLLAAAKAMHTWIFLNTVDEFEVYDECGLTDEMNALLGSMGRFELKQEADDEHTD